MRVKEAAIYARVSTEEQVEGYSIDAQLTACRRHARDQGWTVIAEYVDEGRSARTEDIRKRPRFKAMMEAVERKEFEVLIVHKLDRFSRNLMVTLQSFDQLSRCGIAFVSLGEQIDYTTPMGHVFLAMSGAFAQFYSDNLSHETKKGWHERRRQGLYCGALPFGAMKGEDGIPVPDTQERRIGVNGSVKAVRNHEGLKLAFDLAAEGRSDREIAVVLNACGYRTCGTHESRPFAKDTVRGILTNRFYIGQIPDGNGGWLDAKHGPLIAPEVFEGAQQARKERGGNRRFIRTDASVYSLSGLPRCIDCGNTLRAYTGRKRPRLMCNGRIKTGECRQPSAPLDVYEEQLVAYLKCFVIPEDYQRRILEMQRRLQSACSDEEVEEMREALEARKRWLTEMYEWGHKDKKEYLAEYAAIERQLEALNPPQTDPALLERLAGFLKDITLAWEKASQEQRNRLLQSLFEVIWIGGKRVVGVTPRSEFRPFFELQYEGKSHGVMQWRPRWDSNPRSPA